jgi:hypothetical protein
LLSLHAQISFKTKVSQQPIVVGESFQVQYTISNAEKISGFDVSSSFKSFRFVSGPDIYNGKETGMNRMKQIKNYVFTLEAIRPGHFTIHGTWATIDGKTTRSGQQLYTKEAASK